MLIAILLLQLVLLFVNIGLLILLVPIAVNIVKLVDLTKALNEFPQNVDFPAENLVKNKPVDINNF